MQQNIEDILSDVGFAEVIVKLKTGATSGFRGGAALVARRAATAMPDLINCFVSRSQIASQATATTTLATARARRSVRAATVSGGARSASTTVEATIYPTLGLAVGLVDRESASGLAAHPSVEDMVAAAPLRLIRPVRIAAAAAPSRKVTWDLNRLGIPKLWSQGVAGKGVVVGHLDTGVDGKHPALAGAIDEFAQFDAQGRRVANAPATDSGEHGTHTAGTILGRAVSGTSFGVAPEAKLASGMVIEGGDVIRRILSGMEWLAGKSEVHILSMSLGLPGYSPAFKMIIQALRDRNILPVIAVGNEGPNTSRSPGNYPNVLSVGACDAKDAVADFSGSETFVRPDTPSVPKLVAPGVGIVSCIPGGKYASMDGTSMATPHVAGLAALLQQALQDTKHAVRIDDIEAAIVASCRLAPGMTAERAGAGVPDAVQALAHVLDGTPLPALATYRPSPQAKRPPARRAAPKRGAPPRKVKRKGARVRRHSRKNLD